MRSAPVRVMVAIIITLLAVAGTTRAFLVVSSSPRRCRQESSMTILLRMGGYYSEPHINDSSLEQSQTARTHMVYGIRAVETVTLVKKNDQNDDMVVVTGLQPAETTSTEDDPLDTNVEFGQTMVNYVQDQGIDWTGKHIVEVGSSSTCLAACQALGAASVRVCHPHVERLRLLEHANLFLNNNNNGGGCPLKTDVMKEEPNNVVQQESSTTSFRLPSGAVDFFVFTMGGMNLLEEAVRMQMESHCRILIPSNIIPPEQLSQYHFKESNGVTEILGPAD